MATSSIHETLVIKDNAAALRLLKAMENPVELPSRKPYTSDEERLAKEMFERCLRAHSKQN